MKHGRFLGNIYDPYRPDAKRYLILDYEDWCDPKGHERAWKRHLKHVNANVIGRPQATSKYSQEQLEAMHSVGLYAPLANKDTE